MSDERAIAPVSSDDRIRRANSPAGSSASRAGRSGTRNWLDAAAWKESAYLAEPVKRESPTRTLGEATNATATDDSLEFVSTQRDEAPLDFSMKKRKSTSGVETRISTSPPREDDLSPADASSATYGLMKAFLERRASSPDRRLDADAESVPTGSSPFCLPNRRGPSNLFYGPTGAFPLSLAAAAAAAAVVNANSQPQNVGASADRRHYLTQQLLQRHDHHNQSAEEFGSDNNGDRAQSRSADNPPPSAGPDCQIPALGACTPATPPAFYPGGIPGIHSPHNGHQHSSALQNRNSQQQQKIQRPFKAYNPMDPMSALQVGASLAPSALPFLNAALAPSTVGGSAPSPHLLLPNALTSPATSSSNALPPLLNAQLLSQYRQYLINAQAAAAVAALRAKSTHHLQQQIQQSPQRQSQRQQSQQPHDTMTTPIGAQIGASSQSPPQVTSTSHPHTAESSSSASSTGSPPSPNRLANPNPPASSISAISTASSSNRIRNPNLQQTQSGNGTDRRISSASGSGGSSFNDADEDDEELLHEDDDGISNRTSPTPSCASSTALRRTSILGNGDGAGVCVGNGGERNGSNGTSKGEHGSNGASARRKGRSLPDSLKDDAYWERRRKNNEAAKRSRDARRAKEDEIAIRAALLEQENMRLRIEVAALKAETDKLRQMLLNT